MIPRLNFLYFFYSFRENVRACFHLSYPITKCKSTIRVTLNFTLMLVIPAGSESQTQFQEQSGAVQVLEQRN